MDIQSITTLKQLKSSNYESKSIKDELRDNLIQNLKNNVNVFDGIHGYENTVIPEIERAILSRHNINLLGLRGQAKTRIARQITMLLDEYIPYVSGSEVYDDPFHPISDYAQKILAQKGDSTPISWLNRSERFAEKLATPDVTVADLIGEVDPIKAANLKLSYSDQEVIHYGMIPRANRCIFVINELPDLQARIQVTLFNILQEGDIQIRGFNVRFELDMLFIFTANPEDYTNRGSIVTPLKDRIGSQILTHYPNDIETAKKITLQEAKSTSSQQQNIHVSSLAYEVLEQISFEARKSEFVDEKSGVSARLSITALENLYSTAELRLIKNGDNQTNIRVSDFMGIIPSITGKVELLYEGEQEGAHVVAKLLIEEAIKSVFDTYFPKIKKLEKEDETTEYDSILRWFIESSKFELQDNLSQHVYESKILSITPLKELIQKYLPKLDEKDQFFAMELVLWGLAQNKKLSKKQLDGGVHFQDNYGSFISEI
ncbi:MAG: AAA family ATPase [Bacteroidota bacterium]|nr:AAA family ATPase [Bacteroidota bacterium]